ncbi:hypothetical protein SAMN05421505_12084 [Sinosporangium album]|uniref:Uncharacterized protein n=1 Tax=Sinosporangium album TaxID=504805 RepID=A0A1G8EG32_9ACTN|nr:hypothetical protein [Sinosporangium album]SDH68806.1 hypothetical protein SAMN05421505_12084 [Sinosporangium album]
MPQLYVAPDPDIARPSVTLVDAEPAARLRGERLVVRGANGWVRDFRAESDPYRSTDGSWRVRVLPEAAWYTLVECGLIPPDVRVEDVPLAGVLVETFTQEAPARTLW